jgi:hypothetical protein
VIIAFERDGAAYLSGHGSGVIIDSEGTVLTNAHVLDGAQKIFVQWKNDSGRVGSGEATPLKLDKEQDLGLIRVANLRVDPIAFDLTSVRKGSPVYAIGFPGVAEGDTAEDIRNEFVEATVTSGVVSRLIGNLVQHSAIISGGSSGGALVNECGDLLGINTAVAVQASEMGDKVASAGFSYAINANLAYEFAKKNGVRLATAKAGCETAEGNYRGSGEGAGNTRGLLFSVVALVAAAIAVSMAVMLYRGSQPVAERTSSGSRTAVKPRNKAWTIEGYTSVNQHVYGNVFQAQHTKFTPLILGRDALCGVIVPDATVSRKHAKLFVSEGQLWCSDLHSSNGTKVNGHPCGHSPTLVTDPSIVTLGKVAFKITQSDKEVET